MKTAELVNSGNVDWIVDGHVHLYRGHDLDRLLRAAHARLRVHRQTARCAMLVASANGTVDDEAELRQRLPGWHLETASATLLLARAPAFGAMELHFGRQFVTRERLELLVFGATIVSRGESVLETAERALDVGALVVLPWGAGKWWGARGRLVRAACERFAGRAGFFLGDSAVRPRGWRTPEMLAMAAATGVPIVCGTDPLPVSGEEDRVGSYCFEVRGGTASPDNLIDTMRVPGAGFAVRGKRMSFVSFCRTQARLRLRGR